jgi:Holliday junction resolvase
MSASQRRKGATGEREVAALLAEHWGSVVRRRINQVRDGGHDLEGGTRGFSVEVKRRKRLETLEGWLQQAAQGGGEPVVFMRADGAPWRVLMDASTFIRLAREDAVAGQGDDWK